MLSTEHLVCDSKFWSSFLFPYFLHFNVSFICVCNFTFSWVVDLAAINYSIIHKFEKFICRKKKEFNHLIRSVAQKIYLIKSFHFLESLAHIEQFMFAWERTFSFAAIRRTYIIYVCNVQCTRESVTMNDRFNHSNDNRLVTNFNSFQS